MQSAQRNSRHERRYAASLRPASGPPQETHSGFQRRQPILRCRSVAAAGGGPQARCVPEACGGDAGSPRSGPHPTTTTSTSRTSLTARYLRRSSPSSLHLFLRQRRHSAATLEGWPALLCGALEHFPNESGGIPLRAYWPILAARWRHPLGGAMLPGGFWTVPFGPWSWPLILFADFLNLAAVYFVFAPGSGPWFRSKAGSAA